MSDKTNISWCDATLNPIVGCQRKSPGCDHCYAARQAARHMMPAHGQAADGRGWNGRLAFQEGHLAKLAEWTRPRRVFLGSMTDFGYAWRKAREEYLTSHGSDMIGTMMDRVWRAMAAAPHHTYLLLTKRPTALAGWVRAEMQRDGLTEPPPWLWVGVTCEDQDYAEERVPALLDIPAALHFVSAEPLLGALDLRRWLGPAPGVERYVGWVIAGGESGHDARPAHPDWFRFLRDQCIGAWVPFHFKQWGEWAPQEDEVNPFPWFDRAVTFERVGKHRAGRVLDGHVWDEFPVREGRGPEEVAA